MLTDSNGVRSYLLKTWPTTNVSCAERLSTKNRSITTNNAFVCFKKMIDSRFDSRKKKEKKSANVFIILIFKVSNSVNILFIIVLSFTSSVCRMKH